MIHMTINLKPRPCISVGDKFLQPLFAFNIFVVACPTFGLLVLADTAMPMKGAATLTAGLRNLLQAVCVPLKIFFEVYFLSIHLGANIDVV